MRESANHYNTCLHEQSEALMSEHEDVRELANAAMKQCEPVLQDLDQALKEKGLAKDLRTGFIRHTRNTTVRRLLPELMARQAASQAPAR